MAGTDDTGDTRVDLDEIDTATYVAAKIFGEVTLPKGISAAKADFIEASANFAQMLSYNPTIGVFGGGALD